MAVDKVPQPDFMGTAGQADDEYTIRKPTSDTPSKPLEEAVTAAILRMVKKKFDSRPWQEEDADDGALDGPTDTELDETDGTGSMSSRSNVRSRSASRSVRKGSVTDGEDTADNMSSESSSGDDADAKEDHDYLVSRLSADDDFSYDLLRPKVWDTLSKLDRTLRILHGSWETTRNDQSESDDSATSGSSRQSRTSSRLSRASSREPSQPGIKRKRGRPRKDPPPSVSRGSETPSGIDQSGEKKKSNRGRPRKDHGRLEGETDVEYAVRVARKLKKRIPTFTDVQADIEPKRESSEEGGIDQKLVAKRKQSREPSLDPLATKRPREDWWRKRLKPRDWRNVLHAAALGGFSRGAVDAAARRCATLFNQSADFHFVSPIGQDAGDGVWNRTYVPGMPLPPLLDPVDDDDEQELRSKGVATTGSASDGDGGGGTPSRGRSRSGSRCSRSRSASASAPGTHLCHIRECPRGVAGEGFSRKQNLVRHMRLVHGLQGDAPLPVFDVDSEDEMLGGVHRDGFLKPVKIRPGWRSADLAAEPRKRRRMRKDDPEETDGDRVSSA